MVVGVGSASLPAHGSTARVGGSCADTSTPGSSWRLRQISLPSDACLRQIALLPTVIVVMTVGDLLTKRGIGAIYRAFVVVG